MTLTEMSTYRGNQHPFYRVKWGGRNQHFIQKYKVTLRLPKSERHKKPTSIHGHFYVNGLIFLHSKTEKINFLLIISLASKVTTSFIKACEEIKTKYDTRGFKIMDYHGDNKFKIKAFKTSLLPGLLNIYAKN